jgi:hypothetical protein
MSRRRRRATSITLIVVTVAVMGAARGAPPDRRADVMAATCDYFFRRLELQRPPAHPADFAAAIDAAESGSGTFSPIAALRTTCRASAGSTP